MEFFEEIEISQDLVKKFSEISGDKNPLHLDPEYCRLHTNFENPIAHGILLSSFFSRIIAEVYPGPGSIYLAQDLNFISPCYVGEKINVYIKLDRIENNKYYLITQIFNSEKVLLVEGKATVLKKQNQNVQ